MEEEDLRTEGAFLIGVRIHYENIGATPEALAGVDQVRQRLMFLEAEVVRLAAIAELEAGIDAAARREVVRLAERERELSREGDLAQERSWLLNRELQEAEARASASEARERKLREALEGVALQLLADSRDSFVRACGERILALLKED